MVHKDVKWCRFKTIPNGGIGYY